MILEYWNDYPLMFVVEGVEYSSTLLSDALRKAVEEDAETIKVIAVDNEQGKQIPVDTLDVNKTLRKCFSYLCVTPLRYSLLDNGGFDYPDI